MNNEDIKELIEKSFAKSDKETIREHTDKLLKRAEELNKYYKIDKEIFELLKIACEYHDYGKVNEEFQKRINDNIDGKHTKFDPLIEIPHNFLSIFFLDRACFQSDDDYYSVFYAILYHHYRSDNTIAVMLKERKDFLYEKARCYSDIQLKKRDIIINCNKQACTHKTIMIKGLLHRCDYSASAGTEVEYPNDFLENSMNKLMNTWKKDNPNSEWNDLQKYCMKNSDSNIIITAPTGMGKTEAGLLWNRNSKMFYILPLRTAINSIFNRICKKILENKNIEERLALLHSDNIAYLSKDRDNDNINLFEYRTNARQLALPLTISTPDQIFDFVFKNAGYEMKLATASFSKIIIDEIQAYDSTMLAYIIYGIHLIMDNGGKVAILTATLPEFVKNHLVCEKKQNGSENEDKKYDFKYKDFSDNSIRHNMQVIEDSISVNDILCKYNENIKLNRSNKILVICNTVKKAQEIYDNLKSKSENPELIKLLHAKFTKIDRKKHEDEIMKDGATYNDDGVTFNKKNIIWVATQVVEASLDIDFDYLFTELSELSGLFQRFGRVNRKGKKDTTETNCFVYTKIDNGLLQYDNSNKGFIDENLYKLSCNALSDYNGTISENDKTKLINETFTSDNMKTSYYERNYNDTYDWLRSLSLDNLDQNAVNKKLRNIISYPIIPQSIYEENKEIIDNALNEFNKDFEMSKNKDEWWLKKQKSKQIITDFTVNVGYYEGINDSKLVSLMIEIGNNQIVRVLKCNYDNDRGFSRLTKEQLASLNVTQNEEELGVFI